MTLVSFFFSAPRESSPINAANKNNERPPARTLFVPDSLSRALFRLVRVVVGRGCCFKPQATNERIQNFTAYISFRNSPSYFLFSSPVSFRMLRQSLLSLDEKKLSFDFILSAPKSRTRGRLNVPMARVTGFYRTRVFLCFPSSASDWIVSGALVNAYFFYFFLCFFFLNAWRDVPARCERKTIHFDFKR